MFFGEFGLDEGLLRAVVSASEFAFAEASKAADEARVEFVFLLQILKE